MDTRKNGNINDSPENMKQCMMIYEESDSDVPT